MTVHECWSSLNELVGQALLAMGLPADVDLQVPPDPEMGDVGFPAFAYARISRQSPVAIAEQLARQIHVGGLIREARAVKGYVNLFLDMERLGSVVLGEILAKGERFAVPSRKDSERWTIEYSAPNTNKPLHLGHVRNNLLGMSISNLAQYAGYDVLRLNLINDRGIHICKTMLAYQMWGEGKTPADVAVKGDHFVGKLYVRFDREFKAEFQQWKERTGRAMEEDAYFASESKLGALAQDLLRKWEAEDPETRSLWKTMNEWVLGGFEDTYRRMGCRFDEVQYESQTWRQGKGLVLDGLKKGILEEKPDGAVVFPLEKVGLEGEKVLLRGDGTSLYMTQDLGTALERYQRFAPSKMVYVVGDEQLYHFDVLFRVLDALRPGVGALCFHLAYGMVRLPEGRMKSREGTVVDADVLMDELKALALEELSSRSESGMAHHQDMDTTEMGYRAERIAQAALKFFVLKFTPRKSFEYDPKQSIDFTGQTGPYCLYAYARTRSLIRKGGEAEAFDPALVPLLVHPLEQAMLKMLLDYPRLVVRAAQQLDPAKIAECAYTLSAGFARMFTDKTGYPILSCEEPALRRARLMLVNAVGITIRSALSILGIDVLDEM